jgi:hypothetical protein
MARVVGWYTPEEASRFRPRGVQLFLRDHRLIEAQIHVPEGQPLDVFLGAQGTFTNLTNVHWVGSRRETIPHMAIRSEQILWVAALRSDLPLTREENGRRPLPMEVYLEDGSILTGGMVVAERQRLSDYLAGAEGGFVPVHRAGGPSGAPLGDLAVNSRAILAVHESAAIAAA